MLKSIRSAGAMIYSVALKDRVDRDDVERQRQGEAQALALADREVVDAVV